MRNLEPAFLPPPSESLDLPPPHPHLSLVPCPLLVPPPTAKSTSPLASSWPTRTVAFTRTRL